MNTDDVSFILSSDELILDLKFNSENMNNSQYNIIQIPQSLNYQICTYFEKFNLLIKSSIKQINKNLNFDSNFTPVILTSQLRLFNDGTNDILSFVLMKLDKDEHLVSEVALKITDIYSFNKDKCDIKSIKSFVLKNLKDNEYPDYGLIVSILWANSVNNLHCGIEILNAKRSILLENSYFTYIYYVEFQTLVNSSTFNFIYGVTKDNETVVIRPVYAVPNYSISKEIKKVQKNYNLGNK